MKNGNQTQVQDQTQLHTSLTINTIDAYTLAHEVVSDLSVIFKELEKISLAGHNDDRLSRTLARAGFLIATDRLKFIDEKIHSAAQTHDEIKATHFDQH